MVVATTAAAASTVLAFVPPVGMVRAATSPAVPTVAQRMESVSMGTASASWAGRATVASEKCATMTAPATALAKASWDSMRVACATQATKVPTAQLARARAVARASGCARMARVHAVLGMEETIARAARAPTIARHMACAKTSVVSATLSVR